MNEDVRNAILAVKPQDPSRFGEESKVIASRMSSWGVTEQDVQGLWNPDTGESDRYTRNREMGLSPQDSFDASVLGVSQQEPAGDEERAVLRAAKSVKMPGETPRAAARRGIAAATRGISDITRAGGRAVAEFGRERAARGAAMADLLERRAEKGGFLGNWAGREAERYRAGAETAEWGAEVTESATDYGADLAGAASAVIGGEAELGATLEAFADGFAMAGKQMISAPGRAMRGGEEFVPDPEDMLKIPAGATDEQRAFYEEIHSLGQTGASGAPSAVALLTNIGFTAMGMPQVGRYAGGAIAALPPAAAVWAESYGEAQRKGLGTTESVLFASGQAGIEGLSELIDHRLTAGGARGAASAARRGKIRQFVNEVGKAALGGGLSEGAATLGQETLGGAVLGEGAAEGLRSGIRQFPRSVAHGALLSGGLGTVGAGIQAALPTPPLDDRVVRNLPTEFQERMKAQGVDIDAEALPALLGGLPTQQDGSVDPLALAEKVEIMAAELEVAPQVIDSALMGSAMKRAGALWQAAQDRVTEADQRTAGRMTEAHQLEMEGLAKLADAMGVEVRVEEKEGGYDVLHVKAKEGRLPVEVKAAFAEGQAAVRDKVPIRPDTVPRGGTEQEFLRDDGGELILDDEGQPIPISEEAWVKGGEGLAAILEEGDAARAGQDQTFGSEGVVFEDHADDGLDPGGRFTEIEDDPDYDDGGEVNWGASSAEEDAIFDEEVDWELDHVAGLLSGGRKKLSLDEVLEWARKRARDQAVDALGRNGKNFSAGVERAEAESKVLDNQIYYEMKGVTPSSIVNWAVSRVQGSLAAKLKDLGYNDYNDLPPSLKNEYFVDLFAGKTAERMSLQNRRAIRSRQRILARQILAREAMLGRELDAQELAAYAMREMVGLARGYVPGGPWMKILSPLGVGKGSTTVGKSAPKWQEVVRSASKLFGFQAFQRSTRDGVQTGLTFDPTKGLVRAPVQEALRGAPEVVRTVQGALRAAIQNDPNTTNEFLRKLAEHQRPLYDAIEEMKAFLETDIGQQEARWFSTLGVREPGFMADAMETILTGILTEREATGALAPMTVATFELSLKSGTTKADRETRANFMEFQEMMHKWHAAGGVDIGALNKVRDEPLGLSRIFGAKFKAPQWAQRWWKGRTGYDTPGGRWANLLGSQGKFEHLGDVLDGPLAREVLHLAHDWQQSWAFVESIIKTGEYPMGVHEAGPLRGATWWVEGATTETLREVAEHIDMTPGQMMRLFQVYMAPDQTLPKKYHAAMEIVEMEYDRLQKTLQRFLKHMGVPVGDKLPNLMGKEAQMAMAIEDGGDMPNFTNPFQNVQAEFVASIRLAYKTKLRNGLIEAAKAADFLSGALVTFIPLSSPEMAARGYTPAGHEQIAPLATIRWVNTVTADFLKNVESSGFVVGYPEGRKDEVQLVRIGDEGFVALDKPEQWLKSQLFAGKNPLGIMNSAVPFIDPKGTPGSITVPYTTPQGVPMLAEMKHPDLVRAARVMAEYRPGKFGRVAGGFRRFRQATITVSPLFWPGAIMRDSATLSIMGTSYKNWYLFNVLRGWYNQIADAVLHTQAARDFIDNKVKQGDPKSRVTRAAKSIKETRDLRRLFLREMDINVKSAMRLSTDDSAAMSVQKLLEGEKDRNILQWLGVGWDTITNAVMAVTEKPVRIGGGMAELATLQKMVTDPDDKTNRITVLEKRLKRAGLPLDQRIAAFRMAWREAQRVAGPKSLNFAQQQEDTAIQFMGYYFDFVRASLNGVYNDYQLIRRLGRALRRGAKRLVGQREQMSYADAIQTPGGGAFLHLGVMMSPFFALGAGTRAFIAADPEREREYMRTPPRKRYQRLYGVLRYFIQRAFVKGEGTPEQIEDRAKQLWFDANKDRIEAWEVNEYKRTGQIDAKHDVELSSFRAQAEQERYPLTYEQMSDWEASLWDLTAFAGFGLHGILSIAPVMVYDALVASGALRPEGEVNELSPKRDQALVAGEEAAALTGQPIAQVVEIAERMKDEAFPYLKHNAYTSAYDLFANDKVSYTGANVIRRAEQDLFQPLQLGGASPWTAAAVSRWNSTIRNMEGLQASPAWQDKFARWFFPTLKPLADTLADHVLHITPPLLGANPFEGGVSQIGFWREIGQKSRFLTPDGRVRVEVHLDEMNEAETAMKSAQYVFSYVRRSTPTRAKTAAEPFDTLSDRQIAAAFVWHQVSTATRTDKELAGNKFGPQWGGLNWKRHVNKVDSLLGELDPTNIKSQLNSESPHITAEDKLTQYGKDVAALSDTARQGSVFIDKIVKPAIQDLMPIIAKYRDDPEELRKRMERWNPPNVRERMRKPG